VGDEVELEMSLPLDADGFLRRECPTCAREFKWFAAEQDGLASEPAPAPAPEEGYYCPLCGVQAPAGSWWTQAQLDHAQAVATREVLGPAIEKLADTAARSGGGLVEIRVEVPESPEPRPLSEADDMRRVDFVCHPGEPVKVPDEWSGPVHCLLCGVTVAS